MDEKAVFVKEYLQPLLKAAIGNGAECSYQRAESGREIVSVKMASVSDYNATGYNITYDIDVTADNFIAIAADVIRVMQFK